MVAIPQFLPPRLSAPINPVAQFSDAIRAAGLPPPDVIEADGKLHRFATNSKRGDDAGWYVLHIDGVSAGIFGDWRTGISYPWKADIGRALNHQEETAHRAKVEAMRLERDADKARGNKSASVQAIAIWDAAIPATENQPYLKSKSVLPHGTKILPDGRLAIPMFDIEGKLWNVERVTPVKAEDGSFDKKGLYRGRRTGCFFPIGTMDGAVVLCIAEGFATGASIHQATGHPVAVAFNANNLKPVSEAIRAKFPDLPLILCADDDHLTEGNPGRTNAATAAQSVGATVVVPDFGPDRPNGATDFNDLYALHGLEAVRLLIADAIVSADRPLLPAPKSASIPDQFNLDSFALNGSAAEMRKKMLADKFVVGRLAILGQITFWYASPNVGKTLLILWLLIDAIKRGEIDARDIYFINADDNHKGLTFKIELGEKHGFIVIAPGYMEFKPELLASYLDAMIENGSARGKVVILDTVKKFADIMDKKKGTKFGETVRRFSMHGGTVIGLAHVNKHRDDDGHVVYSGTTDLVDDCDCAYTLDTVSKDKSTGLRTVKFTNLKNRGDVALEAIYEYDFSEDLSYQGKLDSVRSISDEEKASVMKKRELDAMLKRNEEAVAAIRETIRAGTNKKTELIKAAMEAGCLTKRVVMRALKDHTGKSFTNYQFWNVSIEEDNAHIYKLNPFC
ncbi:MAG: toprim domain-containing protein [Rhodocyclaceae bacterium]|nr:toprim domain-containing protein [Rhodocyclaceae bacterium]